MNVYTINLFEDCLVGLPSTTHGDLDNRLHEEHMNFLVAELNVRVSWLLACMFEKGGHRLGIGWESLNRS